MNIKAYFSEDFEEQDVSLTFLRKLIGFSGMFFPIILIIGNYWRGDCNAIENSISAYFHTYMHEFFISILSVIAIGLFIYKGSKRIDSWLSNLACGLLFGVIFFPTETNHIACIYKNFTPCNTLHHLCAGGFFVVLTIFALFIFPRVDKGHKKTDEKKVRNYYYKACGWVMLSCLVSIISYSYFGNEQDNSVVVFVLEWIALAAFGFCWIIKGGAILRDKK